jgi:hypothetical protein
LKYKKDQKPFLKSTKYQVAFGAYRTQIDKLTKKIQANHLWLTTNLNNETRLNGLIIIEAYYGLDEHIYQIDAGLLIFKLPKDIQEYYEAQIVPLKKLLTTKIVNS